MYIQVGKYTIYTDSIKNIWVTKKVAGEKKTGEPIITEVRVSGYCNSFDMTIKDMYRRETFSEDTKDLEEALKMLDAKMKEACNLIEQTYQKAKENYDENI